MFCTQTGHDNGHSINAKDPNQGSRYIVSFPTEVVGQEFVYIQEVTVLFTYLRAKVKCVIQEESILSICSPCIDAMELQSCRNPGLSTNVHATMEWQSRCSSRWLVHVVGQRCGHHVKFTINYYALSNDMNNTVTSSWKCLKALTNIMAQKSFYMMSYKSSVHGRVNMT